MNSLITKLPESILICGLCQQQITGIGEIHKGIPYHKRCYQKIPKTICTCHVTKPYSAGYDPKLIRCHALAVPGDTRCHTHQRMNACTLEWNRCPNCRNQKPVNKPLCAACEYKQRPALPGYGGKRKIKPVK